MGIYWEVIYIVLILLDKIVQGDYASRMEPKSSKILLDLKVRVTSKSGGSS